MKFAEFSKSPDKISEFISLCLSSSYVMHSAHFKTKIYAHHKAYESFYKAIPELIDTFAEVYLSANTFVEGATQKLSSPLDTISNIIIKANEIYPSVCSAGQSALDDIKTLCYKTQYLLSFD